MSCPHGNHPDACDICDEVAGAYNIGVEHTKQSHEWVGLNDEDRQAAFESMPDMLEGFLKTWGWLHFSKAIEATLKEKNA